MAGATFNYERLIRERYAVEKFGSPYRGSLADLVSRTDDQAHVWTLADFHFLSTSSNRWDFNSEDFEEAVHRLPPVKVGAFFHQLCEVFNSWLAQYLESQELKLGPLTAVEQVTLSTHWIQHTRLQRNDAYQELLDKINDNPTAPVEWLALLLDRKENL